MALELIAAFVAGFGAAGVVMLLRSLAPSLVPRFMIPAGAGVAMIAFMVWSEYAWYNNQVAGLPEGVAVASSVAQPSPLRPWTYVFPFVDRFAAVDVGGARRHAAVPEQALVTLYFFQRYTPTRSVPLLVDCAAGKRADLADGATFREDGRVEGVAWAEVGASDPVVRTVCEAG